MALNLRVLGPAEAWLDGALVSIPGAKPRAILTMLGLNSGSVVSSDLLTDVLWGDDAPRTAHKALQTHVSALRNVLGDAAVVSTGSGWRLDAAQVDATDFMQLVRTARAAVARLATSEAVEGFRGALELWRGTPALPTTVRAQAERTRWAETYESVVDDLNDARLATGEHGALIGGLEAALAASPLRERRWAQLCLALYRSGRQGDALAAYQRARAVLIDELGLEPGPDLVRLERAILAQDSAIDTPSRPGRATATQLDDASTEAGTPSGPRHIAQLPVPPTTFVGRHHELQEIARLLAQHRIVTITGPGGVGKTRLAIEAASSVTALFPDRVWYVDLAHARPGLVAELIAGALGIPEHDDRTLETAIAEHIGAQRCLLVLDSCERVRHAVSALAHHLLAACPGVVVLATSRERLGVSTERVVPARPLTTSREPGAPVSDAEALFIERARSVDPSVDADAELVRQVCERCDGLPLAIELAAARCASLGVDGLLDGLDDRLRLLVGTHTGTERHRSLRAVLDWSHDVLDAQEQVMFRRLGIFAGRFSIDAALSVDRDIDLDTDLAERRAAIVHLIGRLTDKNLLSHERTPAGSRWRMLDVVRSYARDRLGQTPDAAAVRERYLRWAARNAERLEHQLLNGQHWREEFAFAVDDLRAALLVDAEAWPDAADRLALALALARLHARQGSFTLAQLAYEQAMALARKTGDAGQLALAALGASEPGMLFGVTQERRVALLEEAVTALSGESSGIRIRLTARLATELYWSAELERSLTLAQDAADAAGRLDDHGALAHATYALHYVTRGPGSPDVRLRLAKRISRSAALSGETQLELAGLAAQVVALVETGDLVAARADVAALSAAADRLDHPEFQWYASVYRLVLALVTGQHDEADKLAAMARDTAGVATEFTVGLYFAEAISDLRERTAADVREHRARLMDMTRRFPRIVLWQCLAALHDAEQYDAQPAEEVRRLARKLTSIEMPDGHWLVACCVVAEAAAAVSDVASARELAAALEPYADELAVAGRVAAFRGSVSYALGLLAATLGDRERAIDYLRASANRHESLGATPFHTRDLAAIARLP